MRVNISSGRGSECRNDQVNGQPRSTLWLLLNTPRLSSRNVVTPTMSAIVASSPHGARDSCTLSTAVVPAQNGLSPIMPWCSPLTLIGSISIAIECTSPSTPPLIVTTVMDSA